MDKEFIDNKFKDLISYPNLLELSKNLNIDIDIFQTVYKLGFLDAILEIRKK
jgi:hypothetical protein